MSYSASSQIFVCFGEWRFEMGKRMGMMNVKRRAPH